jgi:hypothetical protein
MLAQDFIDTVVVFFMFALRIGLPIALTLAFGYWLEKKLRPAQQVEDQTAQPQEQRWTRSGKIIQIHCWDIKRCDATTRAQCAAVQHPDLPCWLALQAEGESVRQECFTCSLYRPQTKVA